MVCRLSDWRTSSPCIPVHRPSPTPQPQPACCTPCAWTKAVERLNNIAYTEQYEFNKNFALTFIYLASELHRCAFPNGIENAGACSNAVANVIWYNGVDLLRGIFRQPEELVALLFAYKSVVAQVSAAAGVCLTLAEESGRIETSNTFEPWNSEPQNLGFDIALDTGKSYLVVGGSWFYVVSFPTTTTIAFKPYYRYDTTDVTKITFDPSATYYFLSCENCGEPPIRETPCSDCGCAFNDVLVATNPFGALYDAIARQPGAVEQLTKFLEYVYETSDFYFPDGVSSVKDCDKALYTVIWSFGPYLSAIARIPDFVCINKLLYYHAVREIADILGKPLMPLGDLADCLPILG